MTVAILCYTVNGKKITAKSNKLIGMVQGQYWIDIIKATSLHLTRCSHLQICSCSQSVRTWTAHVVLADLILNTNYTRETVLLTMHVCLQVLTTGQRWTVKTCIMCSIYNTLEILHAFKPLWANSFCWRVKTS